MIFDTPWEWFLRILLATFIGSLIGYERHNRSKEAGVRTHAIVAMAAATMMIISKYGFSDLTVSYDPARIASTIISGVSFLGAGIIFFKGDSIQGLTTSAGIWATSGIGMCCGAGMYTIAVFSALVMIAVQKFYQQSFALNSPRSSLNLKITIEANSSSYTVISYLYKQGYQCSDIHIAPAEGNDKNWEISVALSTLRYIEPKQIIDKLRQVDKVVAVSLVK